MCRERKTNVQLDRMHPDSKLFRDVDDSIEKFVYIIQCRSKSFKNHVSREIVKQIHIPHFTGFKNLKPVQKDYPDESNNKIY